MHITTLDARGASAPKAIEKLVELHSKLSPKGDVISEGARRITMEVFGKELPPNDVVRIVCNEVRDKGLESLLEFTRHLDNPDIYAKNLRVSAEELKDAHSKAEPAYLETIRKIAGNIRQFQEAIRHQDVRLDRGPGR